MRERQFNSGGRKKICALRLPEYPKRTQALVRLCECAYCKRMWVKGKSANSLELFAGRESWRSGDERVHTIAVKQVSIKTSHSRHCTFRFREAKYDTLCCWFCRRTFVIARRIIVDSAVH